MKYVTVEKYIDIDVDMDDFDTEDLVAELERRGAGTTGYDDGKDILRVVYEKRRLGKDYQTELDQLIWLGLGKIV